MGKRLAGSLSIVFRRSAIDARQDLDTHLIDERVSDNELTSRFYFQLEIAVADRVVHDLPR